MKLKKLKYHKIIVDQYWTEIWLDKKSNKVFSYKNRSETFTIYYPDYVYSYCKKGMRYEVSECCSNIKTLVKILK